MNHSYIDAIIHVVAAEDGAIFSRSLNFFF